MKTQAKSTANAASTNVTGYDFRITSTTQSGQKLTATIPAGTPQRQIAELFEMIGYPAFLYNGKSELNSVQQ